MRVHRRQPARRLCFAAARPLQSTLLVRRASARAAVAAAGLMTRFVAPRQRRFTASYRERGRGAGDGY